MVTLHLTPTRVPALLRIHLTLSPVSGDISEISTNFFGPSDVGDVSTNSIGHSDVNDVFVDLIGHSDMSGVSTDSIGRSDVSDVSAISLGPKDNLTYSPVGDLRIMSTHDRLSRRLVPTIPQFGFFRKIRGQSLSPGLTSAPISHSITVIRSNRRPEELP